MKKLWLINEVHKVYGIVQMMGILGGEPYRWFINKDKVVTMIPLSMLQED